MQHCPWPAKYHFNVDLHSQEKKETLCRDSNFFYLLSLSVTQMSGDTANVKKAFSPP